MTSKRLDEKFLRMCIARFPHATSAISTGCKLNIITLPYVHLSRVITVIDNFQQEMARVMYDFQRRGYNMQPLWRKLRHVLRSRPVYRPVPWYEHHRAIHRFYNQATASPSTTSSTGHRAPASTPPSPPPRWYQSLSFLSSSQLHQIWFSPLGVSVTWTSPASMPLVVFSFLV
jgi:hypothetical protein